MISQWRRTRFFTGVYCVTILHGFGSVFKTLNDDWVWCDTHGCDHSNSGGRDKRDTLAQLFKAQSHLKTNKPTHKHMGSDRLRHLQKHLKILM